jgi:multiple sugar transport system substrate-binding protein
MKKQLYVLVALVMALSMVLAACGTTNTPTAVVNPPTAQPPAQSVRWFVGLGTGTDPAQIDLEQAVVDDFNASQTAIVLTLEVVPYDSAKDTLATQIAAGVGPDIIGPVGWAGSNAFAGQWADISSYLGSFDTSIFNSALVNMYHTDEGTVGLPFAVYPSQMFYQPALFDQAGLAYPPATYGTQYTLNGAAVDWSWQTVGEVAKLLTVDVNGNNATAAAFDKTQIVQYGYSPSWENHPNYYGAYWTAGTLVSGTAGAYTAVVPDAWKAAWQWYYDGIWGAQPYIPNGASAGSPDFGSGNTFASGKIAMAVLPNWYLCCLVDFAKAGFTFQMGAMPSYNGAVHGRIDADTFRIWKGSHHIAAAVTVVEYLVTTGQMKLTVGSADVPPAYGAVPSVTSMQQPFLDAKAAIYPFVTQDSWNIMMAGLSYADSPSAEGYMPNYNEAWARVGTFGDLMNNTAGLDLPAEIATLETDLTAIFNH